MRDSEQAQVLAGLESGVLLVRNLHVLMKRLRGVTQDIFPVSVSSSPVIVTCRKLIYNVSF